MKIEMKYNIGDKMWVTNIFREPVEVKIYGMVAEVRDNDVFIGYYVGLNEDMCVLKKEELIFPTKEELLKSL